MYDFSLIDSDLSAAQRQGGKFGFRVMALDAYIKVRQEGGVERGRGLRQPEGTVVFNHFMFVGSVHTHVHVQQHVHLSIQGILLLSIWQLYHQHSRSRPQCGMLYIIWYIFYLLCRLMFLLVFCTRLERCIFYQSRSSSLHCSS